MDAAITKSTEADTGHGISFGEAFRVWLRVALLSFGGPAGQIAVMHRILVEEKNWISESRFLHALNYCMLLPGPEAQQLATYIGWLLHRTAGGIMAGGLFILPRIIAIMGLSYSYAPFRHLAFLPVIITAAGVIGCLGGRSGRPEFAAVPHGGGKNAAAVDSMLGEELPDHVRPSVPRALKVAAIWLLLWLVPVAALLIGLGQANVFSQIALFFSKMAFVTFGGAYAVLAYVAQQSVEHYRWVQPPQIPHPLAMPHTTPGPPLMVLQFF